jgi:hypothetical protein
MESTLKNRVWKKGPPPHVGWWNASTCGALAAWRWWDGKRWSRVVYSFASAHRAKFSAGRAAPTQYIVEWNDFWPEDARVPRLDGEWTFNADGVMPAGITHENLLDVIYHDGERRTLDRWADADLWSRSFPEVTIIAWRHAA